MITYSRVSVVDAGVDYSDLNSLTKDSRFVKLVDSAGVVYRPVLGCRVVAERSLRCERCELVSLDRPCLRDFSDALQGVQVVAARFNTQSGEDIAIERFENIGTRGLNLPG